MASRKLQDVLDLFAMFNDPADRTNLLLSYADQFKEVPPGSPRGRSAASTSSPTASRKRTCGRCGSRTAR